MFRGTRRCIAETLLCLDGMPLHIAASCAPRMERVGQSGFFIAAAAAPVYNIGEFREKDHASRAVPWHEFEDYLRTSQLIISPSAPPSSRPNASSATYHRGRGVHSKGVGD